jgi:hypothetical protein
VVQNFDATDSGAAALTVAINAYDPHRSLVISITDVKAKQKATIVWIVGPANVGVGMTSSVQGIIISENPAKCVPLNFGSLSDIPVVFVPVIESVNSHFGKSVSEDIDNADH